MCSDHFKDDCIDKAQELKSLIYLDAVVSNINLVLVQFKFKWHFQIRIKFDGHYTNSCTENGS